MVFIVSRIATDGVVRGQRTFSALITSQVIGGKAEG